MSDHPFLPGPDILQLRSARVPVRVPADTPLFLQHRVHDVALLPGAALWELVLAAGRRATGSTACSLAQVSLASPFTADDVGADAQVEFAVAAGGTRFTLMASGRTVCTGVLVEDPPGMAAPLPASGTQPVPVDALYRALVIRGMVHGPALQVVRSAARGSDVFTGTLDAGTLHGHERTTALLDGAMQLAALLLLDRTEDTRIGIPFSAARVVVTELPQACSAMVKLHAVPGPADDMIHCDVTLHDSTRTFARLEDVVIRRVEPHQLSPSAVPLSPLAWTTRDRPAGVVKSPLFVEPAGGEQAARILARARHHDVPIVGDVAQAQHVVMFPPASIPSPAQWLATYRALAEVPRARITLVFSGETTPSVFALHAASIHALCDEVSGLQGRAVHAREPRELPEEALADDDEDVILRSDGRYALDATSVMQRNERPAPRGVVIVGGGGVARAVADHAASTGARVCLLRRTVDAAVPHHQLTVDLADRADVERALREAVAHVGTIDLVVHAAGVASGGTLRTRSDSEVNAVLLPKVRGLVNLRDALARHAPVADVVLVSSSSTYVRGLGGALVDYVAGCAFMDGLATEQRAAGQPWWSIRFPAWNDVGMAARPDVLTGLRARGVNTLNARAGVLAIERARRSGPGDYLVGSTRRRVGALVLERAQESSAPSSPETDEIAMLLAELVAEHMGIDAMDVPRDAPFTSLGLDSLAAIDVVKQLEDHGHPSLPATTLFEHPTIQALARHLANPRATASAPTPRATPTTPAPTKIPLTGVQHAFRTLHRLLPSTPAYAFLRLDIREVLDVARARAAAEAVQRRHPILSVTFPADGDAVQVVQPTPVPWFRHQRLEGALDAFERALLNEPYDLQRGPPGRLVLLENGDRSHLYVCMHHACGDAWSLQALAEDFWAHYAGRTPPALPDAWACLVAAREEGESAAARDDVEWWTARLSQRTPGPVFRSGLHAGTLITRQGTVSADTLEALKATSARESLSLFHLTAAAWVVALARWSGNGSAWINTAHAGRHHRVPNIERAVLPLADTLPIHVEAAGSLLDVAHRVRARWLEAQQHARISSRELGEIAGRTGGALGAAGFSMARFPVPDVPVDITGVAGGTASAATRVGLAAWEFGGALGYSLNFPLAILDEASAAALDAQWQQALRDASAATPRALATVFQHFTERARANPDDVAVEQDGNGVSYRALSRRVNHIVRAVVERTSAQARVALLVPQGLAAVEGVLGILGAGCTWVPLDEEHPVDRLAWQVTHARVALVVAHPSTAALAKQLGAPTLVLDGAESEEGPARSARAEDLAYIIYTSGTSGRPKGVPITHASMENYLAWAISTFGYARGDRLGNTSSNAFDASVRQLLAPVLAGGTVVPFPRTITRDPAALAREVARARLTVWSSVPSLLERLVDAVQGDELRTLRWIHVGGEALTGALATRALQRAGPGARLSNLYGPTEVTINATYHVLDAPPSSDVTSVPIGGAVGGATVHVVDGDGKPANEGELWVGGAGLSPGYLDDAALTARAFHHLSNGERVYRTGDRVRVEPDGALLFLGRLDAQVKIRGNRVEPAEIEAVLSQHPAVRAVAVTVHGQGTRAELVAHVVGRDGEVDPRQLRAFLRTRLPPFMVPRRVRNTDALPVTPTGKVDRALLSEAPLPARAEPVVTDADPLVNAARSAWCDVLDVDDVDDGDDFFDLGGDSVAVVEVFARMSRSIGGLPAPAVLFEHRVFRDFTRALSSTTTTTTTAAPDELLPGHAGFLLADRGDGALCWTGKLRLPPGVDNERLQRAVDRVVNHHPGLRVFARKDGSRWRLATVDAPAHVRVLLERDVVEQAALEPTRWPAYRLVRRGDELHITAHHFVGDAISGAFVAEDVLAALADRELPPSPPLQALHPRSATPADVEHWQRVLASGKNMPRLKTEGAPSWVLSHVFAAEELHRFRACRAGSVGDIVLAAWSAAVMEHTGRPDIIMGIALSGRDGLPSSSSRAVAPLAQAMPVRLEGPAHALVSRAHEQVDLARRHALPMGTVAPLLDVEAQAALAAFGRYFHSHVDVTGRADTGLAVEDGGMAVPSLTTDAMLVSRVDATGMRVELRTSPGVLDENAARSMLHSVVHHVRAFAESPRVTTHASSTSLPRNVDAALVAYLPAVSELAALAGGAIPDDGIHAMARAALGDGTCVEVMETPLGRTAVLLLPWTADRVVHGNASALHGEVRRAVKRARDMGARAVSLAGMLPSLTGMGRAVDDDGVVTSGHAMTIASVVETVTRARVFLGARASNWRFGILGAGSIGMGTLRLLLQREPRPAEIVIMEVPAAVERVRKTVEDVCARVGFTGRVRVGPVDPTLADVDLLVGATSGGRVLEVETIRPGVVIVDDSFPHCFDAAAAWRRMDQRGDVLFMGGGLMSVPGVTRHVLLPGALGAVAERVIQRVQGAGIASCQLESLVLSADPSLRAVNDVVDAGIAEGFLASAVSRGVQVAPLHLGGRMLGHKALERFQGRS